MLKIKDVSIENFRSIAGEPFKFYFDDYCVIVGPNNSGKSNILRALQLFFTGSIDGRNFNPNLDFPRSDVLTSQAKTRITISVSYDPAKDVNLNKAISNLEEGSGQKRLANNILRLRLEFSKRGVLQWRFFSQAGLRNIRAELVEPIVESLRTSIRFKYLPVGRDIASTIHNELSEELIRTIFSGWSGAVKARKEINEAIEKLIEKLQPRLDRSGQEITETISSVFREVKNLKLQLPFDNLETLLPNLTPSLKDHYETPLNQKGSGIQTSTLLFLLKYLADHHPQRHNLRINYIWAIEEPESYLHPSNQKSMSEILMKFSEEVQTIITTHSPHFVPRGGNHIYVVDKDIKKPYSTKIVSEEYDEARRTLGVSLLDSMYLYPYNIVVEGPSDEILMKGAWVSLYKEGRITINPDDVRFFPGGNASGACGLYESFINFGDTDEVKIFLLIDGDDAGKKSLYGLSKRIKGSKEFKSNRDYFQLPVDVEWLTSYRVMMKMDNKFSCVHVTQNTDDAITKFMVDSGNKKRVARSIIDESHIDDLVDFEKVINKIEAEFNR